MKRIILITVGFLVLTAVSVVSIMLVNSKVAPTPLNSGAVYDATKSALESELVHSIVPKAEKSELTFDYTQTGIDSSNNKIDVFVDEDKNEYLFNDKGEQIGFFGSNSGIAAQSENVKISLDDAIAISNEALREINVADREYTMTKAKYFENMQEYSITYHYFVDGYRTSDFVFVDISPEGVLTTYAAPNMGLFDDVDIPEIDKSEIEKTVADYITQTYDCKDYSIDDMILVRKNGLEFSVSYSVTLSDNTIAADVYNVSLS
ncbi:MAG: hypothetical protein K2N06_03950 [Oscillospiraceae bacterium]|nr:hypothetical protein [Oscillospiraceae bacterium]